MNKNNETTDKKKPDDIIKAAKDCLSKYQERESDNIQRAEEAIKFRAGEQWPDAIKRDRENPHQDGGPRPCPVLDKTNQYIRQVVNEERNNRAAIKIRPVDDVADPKVAEIYTGIVRHIEDASNALTAYTTAGEQAIDGGFGYWRILTDYCDPLSFNQDIRIKRIPNRFSVALGPHEEPDGSDAQEGLIWEDLPQTTFEATYPKAKSGGFEEASWGNDETVRVAEYMCIQERHATIYLMPDGNVWTDSELSEAMLDPNMATATRSTSIKTVKWYKLTDQEILDEKEMIGTYIPIVKVIGNELIMKDGQKRLSGMVENMMDPARLHNYAHAGFIEHVALAPRAPWVGAQQAIAGFENSYADANRKNITYLPYNHMDDQGNPLPMPQRTPPAGIAPGWQQMLMNTEHGVEASVGMYGPSVGAKSQEKSGVALQEQKAQGMIGNFHFQDNLSRSIQHTGRILLEWIPKIYDTERVARILGEDGSEVMAYLNPNQERAVMPKLDRVGNETGKTYNLNVGKYDVTVSTGPSYTSKRQEAADNQIQLISAKPELLSLIGDIVFKNMDWPGSDQISKRLKAMLPPQIQQMEAEGQENNADNKMAQLQRDSAMLEQKAHALFQKEHELTAMQQEMAKAGSETEQQIAQLDALKKEVAAERRILSAEQQRFRAEMKAAVAEYELNEKEAGVNPTEERQEPVNVFDSSHSQAFSALAESMTLLTQKIAETNQISMQQGQILSELIGMQSMPKRIIFDNDGNPVGIETRRMDS